MVCCLCGEDQTLVKAHIIPKAFFRLLNDGSGVPRMVSNSDDLPYPKRSPEGVYDEGILCEKCERKFALLDDYAATVLIHEFEKIFSPLLNGDEVVAYRSSDIDQGLLWRFMVSVLWRASVSSHIYFSSIDLGPHELNARKVILNKDASMVDYPEFGVSLSRWVSSPEREALTTAMMSPFKERFGGANFYRLYFGRMVAYCRVDKRRRLQPLRDIELCANPACHVIAREFDRSKDFDAFVQVARIADANYSEQKSKQLKRAPA